MHMLKCAQYLCPTNNIFNPVNWRILLEGNNELCMSLVMYIMPRYNSNIYSYSNIQI